jgi:hypothetical protein
MRVPDIGDKMMQRKWIPSQFCIAVVLLLACCAPKPDSPITTAFDGVYKDEGYSASPSGDCPAAMPNTTLTVSGGYATLYLAIAGSEAVGKPLGGWEPAAP